ncbi:hypothetical protein L9F63_026633, partial [Diploptera punctata]
PKSMYEKKKENHLQFILQVHRCSMWAPMSGLMTATASRFLSLNLGRSSDNGDTLTSPLATVSLNHSNIYHCHNTTVSLLIP